MEEMSSARESRINREPSALAKRSGLGAKVNSADPYTVFEAKSTVQFKLKCRRTKMSTLEKELGSEALMGITDEI